MEERISLGLRFCLLATRRGGSPLEEICSEEVVLRMERRVDVSGMVIGITRVFSAVRRRWNVVGCAEGIVNATDEVGRGRVDCTVPYTVS